MGVEDPLTGISRVPAVTPVDGTSSSTLRRYPLGGRGWWDGTEGPDDCTRPRRPQGLFPPVAKTRRSTVRVGASGSARPPLEIWGLGAGDDFYTFYTCSLTRLLYPFRAGAPSLFESSSATQERRVFGEGSGRAGRGRDRAGG